MTDNKRCFDYFKESYPALGDPAQASIIKAFLAETISEAEYVDAIFYVQHLQRKSSGIDGRLTVQEMFEIRCSEYVSKEV